MPTGISSYLVFRFFVGQQLKVTRLFLNSPRDKRVWFKRTTAGGIGTGILLTLKVMGKHFKGGWGGRGRVEGSQDGSQRKEVPDCLHVSEANSYFLQGVRESQ